MTLIEQDKNFLFNESSSYLAKKLVIIILNSCQLELISWNIFSCQRIIIQKFQFIESC